MNTSYGQITLSKLNDGASPTAYNLIVSHAAVAKSQNGEYNPSSITLSAKSQTGSDPWDDYPGYFKIDTTEDNTTWTNRYKSGANESTKTYEISPDGWAITDSEPYLLRKSAGNGDIKSIAIEEAIVGGSLVWNQLVKNGNFEDARNWNITGYTSSVSNNIVTVNISSTTYHLQVINLGLFIPQGHKYIVSALINPSVAVNNFVVRVNNTTATGIAKNLTANTWNVFQGMSVAGAVETTDFRLYCTNTNLTANSTIQIKEVNVFDLTLMFGATIADYIYTLEQSTAGAGVALTKAWAGITADYYPYDEGSIKSVTGLTAHRMVGKNIIDIQSYTSKPSIVTIDADGTIHINGTLSATDFIRAPLAFTVPTGATYTFSANNALTSSGVQLSVRRADGESAGGWYSLNAVNRTNTFALTGIGVSFQIQINAGTYNDFTLRPQLEYGSTATPYDPYTVHIYPLDSSLTLRGLPKLDGDNLYYDGDVYKASGEVERRYGVVDLGTLNWSKDNQTNNPGRFYSSGIASLVRRPTAAVQYGAFILCSKYIAGRNPISTPKDADKMIAIYTNGTIYLSDITYTESTTAEFKTAMSGVYLLYELATPTTESATPYTTSQVSYAGGTEEYITDGIPVGHVTKYSPDITGIRCSLYLEKSTTTLLDQQTVPIVSDGINGDSGKDAYTVLLTNESHTFAGGKTAAVGGQTATIGVVGYRGTVQRATTVGTITGAPTGMTATISNNSTTSTTVTVSVTSSMTTKNGTLTIPVTVDDTVFNLIFSYAIAFTGASGVGTSGLGWKVNATGLATTNNGECYFYGYNDQNQEVAGNGWVMWNGAKLTIEHGTWINPDEVAPYNTSILHVYRTSSSTPALRHCDVWWDSTTGKWMGYNYSGNNTTPAGKAEWVWDEATDCILATYVEPSKEGKITSAQLFNPPKKFSELPDPKVGFDLEDLTETVEELQPELIVGTHGTTTTATWTGTSTKLKTISAGTRIQYKLSSASTSDVTLNLTLADGTKTGAKNVFYSNTTRLSTQYGINAIIDLVYDGSAWRILNPYTNSNTVGVYGGVITAGTNGAKAYGLVMKDSSTTWASFTTTGGNGASKAKYTGGFEISDLMYYSNREDLAAGSKSGTAYEALSIDFRYSSNCAQTLTSGQELYIVGQIHDDGLFYLDDTWWTQTEPTSNDGKTYIYVGITYSTYQVYLSTSNPAMQFYNGEFLTIEKIETIKAQEAAEAASKVATNYLDFNEQTGLDVGYSGTQAKTRISGDGVEIFDAQGVSMQEISSRTEEVNGQSVQVPFVRTGYTDQGHVETSSGGIDIKYGPEDTEYHTDLIAHLGYGDTVADPIWGEAQPGEIVQAPFYSFGLRALLWEDNDNVDHDADVGQYSFVTGKDCVGGGPWSYVGGFGNVTLNDQSFSTVVGRWNDPEEPGAFVVGGGSAPAIGQRKNTMVVGGRNTAVTIHGRTVVDGEISSNNIDAIGMISGAVNGSTTIGNVSVPANAWTNLGSFELGKGLWIVKVTLRWATKKGATGYRTLAISSSPNDEGLSIWNNAKELASTTGYTYVHLVTFLNPTSTTTYYVNAYNSDTSAHTCATRWGAVCIKGVGLG